MSRIVHIDDQINSRIAKASAVFGRLRWERKGIKLLTKIKVYRAVVMTTLLYACESWTINSRHAKALNHFHVTCLRRFMNIKWQDRIPDTDVLVRAYLPLIFTLLKRHKLNGSGMCTDYLTCDSRSTCSTVSLSMSKKELVVRGNVTRTA